MPDYDEASKELQEKLGAIINSLVAKEEKKLDSLDEESTERVNSRSQKEAEFLFGEAAKNEMLKNILQDRQERLKYAERLFSLVSGWLAGVGLIILFEGFHYNYFNLSDSVLLALLGTTTVNVLGLFYVVTRYLFPSKKESNVLAQVIGSIQKEQL